MAWTTPADPVGGTVITTPWAITNVTNNLRWLRLLCGNADPPGTDYVAVSSGPSATAWGKVTSTVMAVGAAVANIGYTPANKAGDTFTGAVAVPSLTATASISAVTLAAGAGGISTTRSDGNSIQTPGGISAGGGIAATGQVSGGSFGAIHSVAGIAADGAISTANTGSNSLVAAGGASIGGALGVGGAISVTGGNGISAGQYVSTVGGGTGIAPFVVSSSALVDNLNVLLHNGARASVSPSAGTIPIADAAGKLDAWVTSSGGGGGATEIVPGMVIGWTGGSGAIPIGWTRYTAADGRLLVGAGNVGEHTFVDGNSYGTTWAHSHTSPSHGHPGVSHSHSGASLGVAGTIDSSSSSLNGRFTAGGANALPDNHTHNFTLDVSGNTDATTAGVSATTSTVDAWTLLLPVRALLWIQKV